MARPKGSKDGRDRREYHREYRRRPEVQIKMQDYYLSNKERIVVYTRRYKRLALQRAKDLLGGRCQMCGSTERLEFAHLSYPEDYNRKNNDSYSRQLRVIKNPENFLLLCYECHRHPEKYLKELIELKAKLLERKVLVQ